MARFFTSDLHLGSTNINKYASRPFATAEEAVINLCQNANKLVGYADSLIHVGDFMLAKTDRHDTIEDVGLKYTKEDYLAMFKARVFLLAGNHDNNNTCEPDAKSMTVNLNQNYFNVTVGHYPSNHEFYRYIGNGNRISVKDKNLNNFHIHLCGHVHDSWLFKYDWKKNVLNINVGVDAWNYKPVSDVQLTELLDCLKAYLYTKFTLKEDFSMDRLHFDMFVKAKTIEVKKARIARHAEKLAKKGITPEIAEQRKLEAMKKKGLIS